jgi:hypothetical protein
MSRVIARFYTGLNGAPELSHKSIVRRLWVSFFMRNMHEVGRESLYGALDLQNADTSGKKENKKSIKLCDVHRGGFEPPLPNENLDFRLRNLNQTP